MRCSIVVRIVVAQVNVMLRTLNRRRDARDAFTARPSNACARNDACVADIGSATRCTPAQRCAWISGIR